MYTCNKIYILYIPNAVLSHESVLRSTRLSLESRESRVGLVSLLASWVRAKPQFAAILGLSETGSGAKI